MDRLLPLVRSEQLGNHRQPLYYLLSSPTHPPCRYYMDRLLPLVRSKQLDISAVVSHRLPLRDAPRAYELFDSKLEGCTKVVFRPWE